MHKTIRMNKKNLEYVWILVAVFMIVSKINKPERDSWDYGIIALSCIIIGTALYRLFIKK